MNIYLKIAAIGLCLLAMDTRPSFSKPKDSASRIENGVQDEREIIALSKQKWEWMADKNVEKLSGLFHENAKFVHMSGTWKTPQELDIIESGNIWYKKADVHDAAVELFGDTAIVWNRITLLAVVRGNEVSNEFTVTEVYKMEGGGWKLLDLTFSSVRDTHALQH